MAKNRYVNTRFWDDSYIVRLSPNEKLIFLYLLTNPLTTIAGVYELSLKRATFDVGLKAKEISKTLVKLEEDRKIAREGEWIAIVNFIKHQSLNPKVKLGVKRELERAPKSLLEAMEIDTDSLSIGYEGLSHLDLNSNTNLNPNSNSNGTQEEISSTGYPQDVRKGRERLVRKVRVNG